jgi:hypothetical protein
MRQFILARKKLQSQKYLILNPEIKNEYFDKYRLSWKYEHVSWSESSKPLLFDFNDGFLYQRIEKEIVKRISKKHFINHFLSKYYNNIKTQ